MSTKNISVNYGEIIKENNARKALYYRDYDPIIGDKECEVIPRAKVSIDGVGYWLPLQMLKEPIIKVIDGKPFDEVLTKFGEEPTKENKSCLLAEIMMLRYKYDFEFWTATCFYITDKLSKKNITLTLNLGQRQLAKEFERQRLARIPIRVIITKARQWGGSTCTQAYMMWLQLYHYENWHSAIVAKVNNQSINIRAMITKAMDFYPKDAGNFTMKSFEGMLNTKVIPERGCRITISSAENPENLRSYDFAMCHLSEVATWPDTATKSGDDLAQSIAAAIPDEEGTFVVKESTAKGVGGYFHDEWLHATSSDKIVSGKDIPVFVGWQKIPMYTKRIGNYKKFIDGLSEYNWWQWRQGATLEGISWYNNYKVSKRWNDFQMKSEFPTTADEAFQTKSGKYLNDYMIEYLRSTCKEPMFIGDIRGAAPIGKEALDNISIEADDSIEDGVLKIWKMPKDPEGQRVLNRFIVVVDIGGLHHKSDRSVISVFDRIGLIRANGALERAAIWYGHIDHDMLAWKAVQVATFYNNALLVIESNTLDTRDKKASDDMIDVGDHSYTVLNEISEEYSNMYIRAATPDKVSQKTTYKYGWHMNRKTKYQAYDAYRSKIRDGLYIERCNEAVNEASYLQLNRRGQIEAQQGKRDDIQDTTAIGVFLAFDPYEMSMVRIINDDKSRKKKKKNNKVRASTF